MKMVIGLVSPGKLSELSKHMESCGFSGMTISNVTVPLEGHGGAAVNANSNGAFSYKPMIRFEIALENKNAHALVQGLLGNNVIDANAHGLYVFDLNESIRISNGQWSKRQDARSQIQADSI